MAVCESVTDARIQLASEDCRGANGAVELLSRLARRLFSVLLFAMLLLLLFLMQSLLLLLALRARVAQRRGSHDKRHFSNQRPFVEASWKNY